MERIFEFIYPKEDYVGYHFISIIVWQGSLERMDDKNTGWSRMDIRILEGRFVAYGVLKEFAIDCASTDVRGEWDAILKRAEKLKKSWMKKFQPRD